ncbi:MAG: hypothetical protein Q8R06_03710 [Polaromonas sp.]|uniref:hypothetical protein n=1 Tax=Polaromonas sp. TaxID=1869339 RepID=UPI002732D97A|nr:hypothetical protein [Polaromonas sp.]MDP3796240.1 hypothetical protein [Polaromonas sp.]
MTPAMTEVLCTRVPAVLHCADLGRTQAFYRKNWGFEVRHQVPGVIAVLVREAVTLQLWQRRADMKAQSLNCRLAVDKLESWQLALRSAPGQAPPALVEQAWGTEWGISDCEGNRLLLVQPSLRPMQRRARA